MNSTLNLINIELLCLVLKRIGLLGCGTIGTTIARAIDTTSIDAKLTHIYDASPDAANLLASKLESKPQIMTNPNLLFTSRVDIIVEAASQSALRDSALAIIQNKKDLMILSVGALLDESIHNVLLEASKEFQTIVLIPSGAIAGLDGIQAIRDELDSVHITTTKHPNSLRGAPFFDTRDIDIDNIASSMVLFEGPATKAVSLFPANVNVAATLALSGIGGDKTIVRIIADSNTTTNTHKIEAKGKFGKMSFEIENVVSPDNPKTSILATLSAINTLRRYCSPSGNFSPVQI